MMMFTPTEHGMYASFMRDVHNLLNAALDEPEPSPRLTQAAQRIATVLSHPDRQRYIPTD